MMFSQNFSSVALKLKELWVSKTYFKGFEGFVTLFFKVQKNDHLLNFRRLMDTQNNRMNLTFC